MVVGGLWMAQVAGFVIGWLGPWRDAAARRTNGRLALPFRMGLSLSLLLAALLIWHGQVRVRPFYRWVVFGMAASFLGDLIMARLLPLRNRLIAGMCAFAVAHGLYIRAYVAALHGAGVAVAGAALWSGLMVYGLAAVGGWWLWIRNPRRPLRLNLGALAYGVWIGVMAAFALAAAAALGGAWWCAAAGASFFVASDFLIGVTEIRGRALRNANDWIWVTYVAAQMGIIYSAWL
jgi:uncharacterized membrane protein YhhN